MSWDVDMFDQDQGFQMKAHATSINEELGQIEYIFSDKTGTLTKVFSHGLPSTSNINMRREVKTALGARVRARIPTSVIGAKNGQ